MNTPPRAVILPLESLEDADETISDIGVAGLARAIASTPGWNDPEKTVIVAQETPTPRIAVLGFFTPVEEERLEGLRNGLAMARRHMRYVTYEQAEADTEALADALRDRFTAEDLSRARFAPIPRGGLLVLGMLSYFLELDRDQFHTPPEEAPLLVIVDDCAISGARFRETLARYPDASDVIFAHLYSPPEVRRAIEQAEPSVKACVSVHDLRDRAPDIYGDDYEAWRGRWQSRTETGAYWNGMPDRVCFPWTEPDMNVWNETAGRSMHGWRVVPPERCIKNRVALREGPSVFIQPQGTGSLRPAPEVLFGPVGERMLIARTEDEACYDLQGTAAVMWGALVTSSSVEEVHEALAARYNVEPGQLRNDLEHFVEQLLESKLLVRTDVRET